MYSSPPFTLRQVKEGEEEELLAIEDGRSHTSSPRSRPKSRLKILMMDMVQSQTDMARSQEERSRSTEQKLEILARAQSDQIRSQAEVAKSTKGQLDVLARGQADLAYAHIGA